MLCAFLTDILGMGLYIYVTGGFDTAHAAARVDLKGRARLCVGFYLTSNSCTPYLLQLYI